MSPRTVFRILKALRFGLKALAPFLATPRGRRSVLATLSFLAMGAGFWMAWPPLGLIVPGSLVFAALTYSHLTTDEKE